MSKEFVKSEALDAISSVSLALGRSTFNVGKRAHALWRVWFPYCIRGVGDDRPTHPPLIVLNRSYKPLGMDSWDPVRRASVERVDYAASEYSSLHFDLPHADLVRVALNSNEDGHYWLFDDATAPWKNRQYAEAYVERLRIFADLLSPPSPRTVGRRCRGCDRMKSQTNKGGCLCNQ